MYLHLTSKFKIDILLKLWISVIYAKVILINMYKIPFNIKIQQNKTNSMECQAWKKTQLLYKIQHIIINYNGIVIKYAFTEIIRPTFSLSSLNCRKCVLYTYRTHYICQWFIYLFFCLIFDVYAIANREIRPWDRLLQCNCSIKPVRLLIVP